MLRDLSPELMNHLLSTQLFGRIGCAADGKVLVLPVAYLYDGKAIYGNTREGTKTRMLRQNPAVCFEVDEVCSPTCWRSVVVQGIYEELEGDERIYAEHLLGPGRVAPDRAAPQSDTVINDTGSTIPSAPLVVYRIRIQRITGRSEIKE